MIICMAEAGEAGGGGGGEGTRGGGEGEASRRGGVWGERRKKKRDVRDLLNWVNCQGLGLQLVA